MIDLHTHTTYSDGTDSLKEVLMLSNDLEVISITDHDSCEAYLELEDSNIRNIFKGEIINGVEISTSFKKYKIELLAYGFKDYIKVNNYLQDINSIDWDSIYIKTRLDLLNRLDNLNLKYDLFYKDNLLLERYETKLYNSLIKNNNNLKEVLKDEYCNRASMFYRKCISNPNSMFFLDYVSELKNINEIVDFIHNEGGILFFAHPFSYGMDNIEKFLEELFDECNIDGGEVYHSYATKENSEFLLNFANENNLLISGGSDYHGSDRPLIKIGTLFKSGLTIDRSIMNNWRIKKD